MDGMQVSKSHKAYGRPENPANFVTCLIAVVLSFVGVVFLLLHSVERGGAAVTSAAVTGALFIVVFIVGAVSHIVPLGGRHRANAQRFDRCSVCALALAVVTPVFLYGFAGGGHADAVWGYVLFAVAASATAAAVILNFCDVKNAKIFSLALYVIVAWAVAMRADLIVALCGWSFFWMLIAAFALYVLGIAVCAWNAVPARHTVRHICIILGTALAYAGVYVFLF